MVRGGRGWSQFPGFPLVQPADLLSLPCFPIGPTQLTFWLARGRRQSYTPLRYWASKIPPSPLFAWASCFKLLTTSSSGKFLVKGWGEKALFVMVLARDARGGAFCPLGGAREKIGRRGEKRHKSKLNSKFTCSVDWFPDKGFSHVSLASEMMSK